MPSDSEQRKAFKGDAVVYVSLLSSSAKVMHRYANSVDRRMSVEEGACMHVPHPWNECARHHGLECSARSLGRRLIDEN